LHQVEPTDLVKFGLIPEFVGRVPVVASVNNLQVDDLVRVLKEPRNSLLKQYEGLFNLNHVRLRFSQAALKSVAAQALEKKTGARGLRRIMVNASEYILLTSCSYLYDRKTCYWSPCMMHLVLVFNKLLLIAK
jgi:ATP-dependent protease Clp ATPase subunit